MSERSASSNPSSRRSCGKGCEMIRRASSIDRQKNPAAPTYV
jgi:hypothetical protein